MSGEIRAEAGEKSRLKVRVSELTQYEICPRLVYFGTHGSTGGGSASGSGYEHHKRAGMSTMERIILKEMAFNLHRIIRCDNHATLMDTIGDIVECVPRIYRDELAACGLEGEVIASELERVKCAVVRTTGMDDEEGWRMLRHEIVENEQMELERVYGYERERMLYSEKLNLSGSVDKLIITDEELIPCMVKTGKTPEYGIWRSDRIQLAAYAMLIEDEFGSGSSGVTVRRGFVQYIRDVEFRDIQIRRSDRALALQILSQVKRIKRGLFPHKSRSAPCENCIYATQCETRKTLLSKLFGK